jgi:DNA-binding PadR family transcriptional regulator
MQKLALREFDFYILACVAEEPVHGYLLIKKVQKLVGETEGSSSGIYYSLRKLLGMGLVNVREKESEKAPLKKIFSITKKGRHYLNHELDRYISETTQDTEQLFIDYLRLRQVSERLSHLKATLLQFGSQSRTLS